MFTLYPFQSSFHRKLHTLPDTDLPGFETYPEVQEDFLTLEDGTDGLSRNVD